MGFDLNNITLESAKNECFRVYGTRFGHNMIGIIINKVAEKFGEKEADKLFEEYQK